MVLCSTLPIIYTREKAHSDKHVPTRDNNRLWNGRKRKIKVWMTDQIILLMFSRFSHTALRSLQSYLLSPFPPSICYPFFNSFTSFHDYRTRDTVNSVHPYRKVQTKMQIFYPLRRLMGDVHLFLLLSSALTLAFRFESLPQNAASIFRRSLPGSLGWAPAGAVGYYYPPGRVAKPPVPTETKASSTSAAEITHELRRQFVTETGTVPR